MTEAERQVLEDARAACLASAEAITTVLASVATEPDLLPVRDLYVPLKTAAAAWGIMDDAARKRAKALHRTRPEWATKRGAGKWWVHREALR